MSGGHAPGGHGDAPATSARTDLILAAVFLAFGAAVVAASAEMPTFTDQGTPIYVAPGLVPGFHGLVIAVLSVLLAARSILRTVHAEPAATGGSRPSLARVALATMLAVGFAGFMIGRMPFWLAAALFVFAFIMAFEWERGMARAVLLKNAAIAAAIGSGAGLGISLVFERLFLIHMP